ncbi:hypothetical protein BDW75DRAFT_214456 [Aspergillus navahoensis]
MRHLTLASLCMRSSRLHITRSSRDDLAQVRGNIRPQGLSSALNTEQALRRILSKDSSSPQDEPRPTVQAPAVLHSYP